MKDKRGTIMCRSAAEIVSATGSVIFYGKKQGYKLQFDERGAFQAKTLRIDEFQIDGSIGIYADEYKQKLEITLPTEITLTDNTGERISIDTLREFAQRYDLLYDVWSNNSGRKVLVKNSDGDFTISVDYDGNITLENP